MFFKCLLRPLPPTAATADGPPAVRPLISPRPPAIIPPGKPSAAPRALPPSLYEALATAATPPSGPPSPQAPPRADAGTADTNFYFQLKNLLRGPEGIAALY